MEETRRRALTRFMFKRSVWVSSGRNGRSPMKGIKDLWKYKIQILEKIRDEEAELKVFRAIHGLPWSFCYHLFFRNSFWTVRMQFLEKNNIPDLKIRTGISCASTGYFFLWPLSYNSWISGGSLSGSISVIRSSLPSWMAVS